MSIDNHILRVPSGFISWLRINREEIIEEWISRARALSHHYGASSQKELQGTIGKSFEANLRSLEEGSAEPLIEFVDFITELRLRAGFLLSVVQKAFDLYRIILTARMPSYTISGEGLKIIEAVNSCVSYQIHRFSDQFQLMHEEAIRRHAENLEALVKERTADLAASEQRYKTLVEEINDGYFVLQDERSSSPTARSARCTRPRSRKYWGNDSRFSWRNGIGDGSEAPTGNCSTVDRRTGSSNIPESEGPDRRKATPRSRRRSPIWAKVW